MERARTENGARASLIADRHRASQFPIRYFDARSRFWMLCMQARDEMCVCDDIYR